VDEPAAVTPKPVAAHSSRTLRSHSANLAAEVTQKIDELDHEHWGDDLTLYASKIKELIQMPPGVEVRYENLTWTVKVAESSNIPTVVSLLSLSQEHCWGFFFLLR
jgi:hypothetical protein